MYYFHTFLLYFDLFEIIEFWIMLAKQLVGSKALLGYHPIRFYSRGLSDAQ